MDGGFGNRQFGAFKGGNPTAPQKIKQEKSGKTALGVWVCLWPDDPLNATWVRTLENLPRNRCRCETRWGHAVTVPHHLLASGTTHIKKRKKRKPTPDA